MASARVLYLNAGFEVWGSGFHPSESIEVYIDLDAGVQPIVGFADAGPGGAWTLEIERMDNVRGLADNASRLTHGRPLTLMAEGSEGSKASVPVVIRAEAATGG